MAMFDSAARVRAFNMGSMLCRNIAACQEVFESFCYVLCEQWFKAAGKVVAGVTIDLRHRLEQALAVALQQRCT